MFPSCCCQLRIPSPTTKSNLSPSRSIVPCREYSLSNTTIAARAGNSASFQASRFCCHPANAVGRSGSSVNRIVCVSPFASEMFLDSATSAFLKGSSQPANSQSRKSSGGVGAVVSLGRRTRSTYAGSLPLSSISFPGGRATRLGNSMDECRGKSSSHRDQGCSRIWRTDGLRCSFRAFRYSNICLIRCLAI